MTPTSTFTDFSARLGHADRVEVLHGSSIVAVGRWDGIAIRDLAPALPLPAEEIPAILRALALQIEAESLAAWQALPPACNEDGVDVSLIDWMLALTPSERLAILQDFADTFLDRDGGAHAVP